MRIASLTNTPLDPALGSGKAVIAWTDGLRRLGHHVDVFGPAEFHEPWPRANRLKIRQDALRLEGRIIDGAYDLVECYGSEFGALTRRLRRRRSRPFLVAHAHGPEFLASAAERQRASPRSGNIVSRIPKAMLNAVLDRADRWAFTMADAFVSGAQVDADHLASRGLLPAARCAAVAPGLDDAYLQADWTRPKEHKFIYLGTWTTRKDPETLMAAAEHILAADPDVEFHILGAWGAERKILQEIPAEMQRRLVIHPKLDETRMVEILSTSKVLLFPSLYEGLGMATTEAMACGCAVVVTPTGFGASIRNGIDGMVCPFGDAEKMAAAVLHLLQHEAERAGMAVRGRERVAEMSWERQVAALESLYLRWLAAA